MNLLKIWSFLKLLKVEPYQFLRVFAGSVTSLTGTLLLQDKICRNKFNQTDDFCMYLNNIKQSEDPQQYKDQILSVSAQYGLYSTLIKTLPEIVWCLLIGSLVDRYIGGRKLVLCFSSVGEISHTILQMLNAFYFYLGPEYMLLTSVPFALSGGSTVSLMAIYSFVSVATPDNRKSLRYTLIELCTLLGQPLGTFIGGQILKNTPNSSAGQLHNYNVVFSVSLTAQILALLFIYLAVNEKPQTGDNQEQLINDNQITDSDNNNIDGKMSKWYHLFRLLFDSNNIKQMWNCCAKYRENRGRTQLWLVIISMFFVVGSITGLKPFHFLFIEKVYYWSATYYSNVHAINSIVNTIAITFVMPFCVLRLELSETSLAIIGIISIFLSNLLIGSYPSAYGYYVSIILGSAAGMTAISLRTKLSKLVTKQESGKVFSLLSILESLSPSLAGLFFTLIFGWSLNFFPGLVFEFGAAFMIIPLLSTIWIDLNTLQTS